MATKKPAPVKIVKNPERIICIDPGLIAWGIAAFNNNTDDLIDFKTVLFKGKRTQEDRLNEIYCIIDQYCSPLGLNRNIHIVGEKQFVNTMQMITGVLMSVAGKNAATCTLMPPMSWKKLAFGKGNIPEDELRNKVINIYPELINESEHVIDCAGMFIAYKNKMKAVTDEKVPKKNKRRKTDCKD